LTINVNVGQTTPGDGQPTTVGIPSYTPTITADGGRNGSFWPTPKGRNDGFNALFGTGFAAAAQGNGTSEAYKSCGSLSIWKELANKSVSGTFSGVGGGGGKDKVNGYLYQPQPGAVFLLIRGVIYY